LKGGGGSLQRRCNKMKTKRGRGKQDEKQQQEKIKSSN
jgi:hypothetical protein